MPPEIESSSSSNFMPRAAAVAELAALHVGLDLRRRDRDARGQTLEDRDELGPVRLPRGQPAQHGSILHRRRASPAQQVRRRDRIGGDDLGPRRERARRPRRPVTKMRTCATAWCSSISSPLTTVPPTPPSSSPARSATGRTRRRAAPRSARIASGYGMSTGVPPGSVEITALGMIIERSMIPIGRIASSMPERRGQRLERPRLLGIAGRHQHARGARAAQTAASTDAAVAPAPSTCTYSSDVTPASPRAPTTPATSVLKPCFRPSVEQHGVRGADPVDERRAVVQQRQHLVLQRHRQRETPPRRIAGHRGTSRDRRTARRSRRVRPVEPEHAVRGARAGPATSNARSASRARRAASVPPLSLTRSTTRSPRSRGTRPAAARRRPRAGRPSRRTPSRRSSG